MRAHYRAPVQDSQGNLLPGTAISIYVNGTTTLIADAVYADGTSGTLLGNPFVTSDGNISFYLATPQRVDLGIQPPGQSTAITPDIDVETASASSAALTFPGAGSNSTQVGTSAAAGGTSSSAYGVSATASAAQDTALGEAATASGGSSTAAGQGSTAAGYQSTAVGVAADAGSSATQGVAVGNASSATASGAVAVGGAASATAANAAALGAGAAAGGNHATAVGAGASAGSANQVVLGTTADDVVVPGGLVLSESVTPATLSNGSTITFTGPAIATVTATGNVTGLILAAGAVSGQTLIVINESAFTLTFAIAATSHVADGVSDVIAATTARKFLWDSNTSLWYRTA